MSNANNKARLIRKRRSRAKVFGTAKRPRLSVFRSLRETYVQAIDDESGKTLASASSKELGKSAKNNVETAEKVGELIAEKCKKAKIDKVVFDRSGYNYHGKVKAIADGARKGKLEF